MINDTFKNMINDTFKNKINDTFKNVFITLEIIII